MAYYILLHGALGVSSQLLPLKAQLENTGHIVYTLNFSGHGGQPFSEMGFGIEIFAEELLHFLNSQKIERVNIFGYSMGGYVALCLAHQHPERFQKIITLGTKFDWSPEIAAKEVKMLDPEKLQEKVPAFAETLKQRHLPNDWKILLQKTAEMMLALGNKPLLTDEVLKQIKIPTMICQGEMDTMADINYTKQVAGYLPQAEFKMLANTQHPIEKVELNKIIELLSA
jgi:pimeloyl-ACP methyl ester carboxylesterase